MSTFKYLDKQGNIEFAVSSGNPLVTIIPPGRTISDAVPMTHEEFQKHVDHVDKLPVGKDPMQAQIEDLKAQLKALQGKQNPPGKP